mmetsp:Transcript_2108/g.4812  ORF Transcript_2108/g.4812 Transcript_2108/m.4812 type:complete len:236 (+) Transcript_2108:1436-2143(+)
MPVQPHDILLSLLLCLFLLRVHLAYGTLLLVREVMAGDRLRQPAPPVIIIALFQRIVSVTVDRDGVQRTRSLLSPVDVIVVGVHALAHVLEHIRDDRNPAQACVLLSARRRARLGGTRLLQPAARLDVVMLLVQKLPKSQQLPLHMLFQLSHRAALLVRERCARNFPVDHLLVLRPLVVLLTPLLFFFLLRWHPHQRARALFLSSCCVLLRVHAGARCAERLSHAWDRTQRRIHL